LRTLYSAAFAVSVNVIISSSRTDTRCYYTDFIFGPNVPEMDGDILGLEIEKKTAAVISTIVVATVNKTNNHF